MTRADKTSLLLTAALLLLAAILLASCGHRAARPLTTSSEQAAVAKTLAKADTVKEQHAITLDYKALYDASVKREGDLRDESRAAALYWTAGILGFVALLAAIAIFVPVLALLRGTFAAIAAGAGVAASACWFLGDHVAWLPWIGGSVLLALVGVLFLGLRKWFFAHRAAVQSWAGATDYLREINPSIAAVADGKSLSLQGKLSKLNDKLLRLVK